MTKTTDRIPIKGEVFLRAVTAKDSETLFEWRNQPELIAFSSSGRTVTRQEHETFMAALLARQSRLMFIVASQDGPIGQVRFDRHSDECDLSIHLVPEWRGRGLGPSILVAAAMQITDSWAVRRIRAYVRSDNERSMATFRKAGFFPTGAPATDGLLVFERIVAQAEAMRNPE